MDIHQAQKVLISLENKYGYTGPAASVDALKQFTASDLAWYNEAHDTFSAQVEDNDLAQSFVDRGFSFGTDEVSNHLGIVNSLSGGR